MPSPPSVPRRSWLRQLLFPFGVSAEPVPQNAPQPAASTTEATVPSIPRQPLADHAPAHAAERHAADLFLQAARRLRPGEVRSVRVSFHPFRATLFSYRLSPDGRAKVRLHTAFRTAPENVLSEACGLMLCRTARARRRAPRAAYDAFARALPPEAFSLPGARKPGLRARPGPGRHHSLEASFARVNAVYFNSALTLPVLCWSPRCSRRILGTYHERGDRVLVSRLLDSASVPDFVVDYVMYHELLHRYLAPQRRRDGRRSLHGPEFKRLERRYARYAEAKEFLRKLPHLRLV